MRASICLPKLHPFRRHFRRLTGACVFLALVVAGCRAPLYRAAARGDVAVVRQELERGADMDAPPRWPELLWRYPLQLGAFPIDLTLSVVTFGQYNKPYLMEVVGGDFETPAAVAWRKGHTQVLSALAQAGVALAPDTVVGRTLLLQEDWRWNDGFDVESKLVYEMGNENVADCFELYWMEDVDWVKSRGVCIKHLIWGKVNGQGRMLSHRLGRKGGYHPIGVPHPELLYYRRTGVQSAEVTERYCLLSVDGKYRKCGSKYELLFESSTSGTYRQMVIDARYGYVLTQYEGRFWLK